MAFPAKQSFMDDWGNVILLLILYTLQGIPMGLSGCIPLLMQGSVTYTDQSLFSLVTIPFSIKLLWAPIVDSVNSSSFGRRKSWLVPVQSISGVVMLWGGYTHIVERWLTGDHLDVVAVTGKPCIMKLTLYFCALYFLMATQDIAVDGWALTMLSPANRDFASTCNSVGQTFGYLIVYVGFLFLNDASICNKWFRSVPRDKGILSLSDVLIACGVVMIATTILLLFKSEGRNGVDSRTPKFIKAPNSPIEDDSVQSSRRRASQSNSRTRVLCTRPIEAICGGAGEMEMSASQFVPVNVDNESPDDNEKFSYDDENHSADVDQNFGLKESYSILWCLMKKKPIQLLMLIMMTCKLPFGITDSVTQLKLLEKGLPKAHLAFFTPFLLPFGIISPVLVGKLTRTVKPLTLFRWGLLMRLPLSIFWDGLVRLTGTMYPNYKPMSSDITAATQTAPFWFYSVIAATLLAHNICSDFMFVSQVAFFARVSDARIGGTYMTMLNTIANLGSKWPSTLSLWLVDVFTSKDPICVQEALTGKIVPDGGVGFVLGAMYEGPARDISMCRVIRDGYHTLVPWFVIIGLAWLFFFSTTLKQLDGFPLDIWKVDISYSKEQMTDQTTSKVSEECVKKLR